MDENPLPIAVLSGPNRRWDATRLQNKNLDIRIGEDFGRTLTLTGMFQNTSLQDVAAEIQRRLRKVELPISKATMPTVTWEEADSYCKLAFGPKAIPKSKLAAQWLEEINDGAMAWKTPRIVESIDPQAEMLIFTYKKNAAEELVKHPDEGHPFSFNQLAGASLEEKLADLVDKINSTPGLKCARTGFMMKIELSAPGNYPKFEITDVPDTPSLGWELGLLLINQNMTGQLTEISAAVTDITEIKSKIGNTLPLTITVKNGGYPGKKEITFDLSAVSTGPELVKLINSKLDELKAPAGDVTKYVTVEVVKDRLLIWDKDKDISLIESPAATILNLTKGAEAAPMNLLAEKISMVGTLLGGDDGSPGGQTDYENALAELETKPDVSIICLPNHQWNGNGDSRSIIDEAINQAQRQGDRMVIVDPPNLEGTEEGPWKTEGDVRSANLPTSKNCALYYPWVRVAAPRSNGSTNGTSMEVLVPPSGFAAGVWSLTDKERGVWKAPAGVDTRIRGIASLVHDLTDIQGGALNRYGVNVLRNLPGYGGPVVWGGRTLATKVKPQWKYLSVRRTALMIEDSLRENMLWAVHEPNRSELWSALRVNIDAFMNRLWRAGAFQPDTAKEAYFVKCGKGSTMTQGDIDAGIVRVEVGFAPVKPAEFVVITIEQINENR